MFGAEILRRGIGGTGPKWMEREYEEPVDRDDTHPSVQRGDRGIEVWRLSLQIPFHGHTDPVISGTSPPACAEQYPREISNQEIYYLRIYHKKKKFGVILSMNRATNPTCVKALHATVYAEECMAQITIDVFCRGTCKKKAG